MSPSPAPATASASHYFKPIEPRTGALHAQPGGAQIRHDGAANVLVFLPEYRTELIPCDSLDAPLCVPSGGTRAWDLDSGSGRIAVAHIWRDEVHA